MQTHGMQSQESVVRIAIGHIVKTLDFSQYLSIVMGWYEGILRICNFKKFRAEIILLG